MEPHTCRIALFEGAFVFRTCVARRLLGVLKATLLLLCVGPVISSPSNAAPSDGTVCANLAIMKKDPCQKKKNRLKLGYCDADNDWLSNKTERAMGTDPMNPDTDNDGMADGVEWKMYGTSPLVANNFEASCLPVLDPSNPSSGGGNFPCDINGNTSMFGIPLNKTGNISAGAQIYQQTCLGCHPLAGEVPKANGYSLTQLQAAMNLSPMNVAVHLVSQQLYDLTAYLNLRNTSLCATATPAPTPATGSPAPTATPVNSVSPTPTPNTSTNGQALYAQYCQSCHNGQQNLGSVSLNKLNNAIQEKPQMQFLSFLTTAQRQAISTYINTN